MSTILQTILQNHVVPWETLPSKYSPKVCSLTSPPFVPPKFFRPSSSRSSLPIPVLLLSPPCTIRPRYLISHVWFPYRCWPTSFPLLAAFPFDSSLQWVPIHRGEWARLGFLPAPKKTLGDVFWCPMLSPCPVGFKGDWASVGGNGVSLCLLVALKFSHYSENMKAKM